ncbi:Hypothetical predicted protein [Cloeon dipterum]|uniref:Uncharacterized protein n=1 Tax=Cloeon dipterum TaxID=197152 RepID=A0A8S1E1H1_9INSE|nr:Hypothetical predicted protein [Cloeon dipterum]
MQPDGRGPAQGASSHAKKIRNDSAARAEANQMDRQPLMTDGQEEGGGNKGKGMAQPEKEVVSFYKHKNLYKFFGSIDFMEDFTVKQNPEKRTGECCIIL